MYVNKIKKFSKLTIKDYLTVDAYDKIIRVRKAKGGKAELLVNTEAFFRNDGLYVKPQTKGLRRITGEDNPFNENQDVDYIELDKLLNDMDNDDDSYVLLIEGYAGCGKSTLVQDIIQRKLGFYSETDYALYNYNIEENCREENEDDNGELVKNSSIYYAIKKCFIHHFCKYYAEVYEDFKDMIDKCDDFIPFRSAYHTVNSEPFERAIRSLDDNNVNKAKMLLNKHLLKKTDPNCILAIDFIFRLALFMHGAIGGLYVCYDNLDKIEDAADLKGFDNNLTAFRDLIDGFINDNYEYFDDHFSHNIPRFVIMATYRKITSVLAELDYYNEVNDDFPQNDMYDEHIIRIDATSAYSYKDIVEQRTKFFDRYFKSIPDSNPIKREAQEKIETELLYLKEWNELNKNLAIMQDRYSVLWNKNYRTCSEIAEILFSNVQYNFDYYIDFIKELSNFDSDGYNSEADEGGASVLCTYYGKSAILLNSVCRVFKHKGIWDSYLNLTKLRPVEPKKYKANYKDVSLSRLILTYIHNKRHPSLIELYKVFCSKGLFSCEQLCECLSKMIARNSTQVWRRPIYYYKECILANKAEDICSVLLDECKRFENDQQISPKYYFQLCDSGKAYVENLMSEFEFYSSRLKYRNGKDNLPLYMYNSNIPELKRIMREVVYSVHSCCQNMIVFGEVYKNLYGLSDSQYLDLDIHPKTNWGNRQLHIERIIFAHVAYLDRVRFFYMDPSVNQEFSTRKQYNDLFIEQINLYLLLYKELVYKVSKDREEVFNKLLAKVKNNKDESTKEQPNEKELLRPISINRNEK